MPSMAAYSLMNKTGDFLDQFSRWPTTKKLLERTTPKIDAMRMAARPVNNKFCSLHYRLYIVRQPNC
jgi:hypothetical protein